MAKSLRNTLKTSKKLETEGIELELANTRVRLARAGGQNTRFNAAMTKVLEKHKRAIDLKLLDDDKAFQALYEVFAEHVVLVWETNVAEDGDEPKWLEGIEGDGGELLPVTFENVVAYFTDVPEFFLEVKKTAEDGQFYRQALVKGISGN